MNELIPTCRWRHPVRFGAVGWLIATVLFVACPHALGQAPPPNPVFVNNSPEAARLLSRADAIAATNPAESVRLIQQVLDDHQKTLVPSTIDPDLFQATRQRALGLLIQHPDLLDRYRRAESVEAQRLLTGGQLESLIETRPLTLAGLEALLLLGQHSLEDGQFDLASARLEEALAHPLLTDRDRGDTWFMLGLVAHADQADDRRQAAIRQLTQREDADLWLAALRTWTATEVPRPRVGADTLTATDTSVGSILAPDLWTTLYDRTPASIQKANEMNEAVLAGTISSGRLNAILPTARHDVIFFNEGAELVRVDLLTGMEDWRTSLLPPLKRSELVANPIGPTTVAVDGDDVVTWIGYSLEGKVSETEVVLCVDARTGRERWRFDLSNVTGIDEPHTLYPASPPVIHGAQIYVIIRRESRQGLKSTYLLALDRRSGTPRFLTYIASTGSQYRDGSLRPLTKPVVDGDQIIVASSIGAIAAIDAASGRIRWIQRMGTPVSGTHPLVRMRPYDVHMPLVLNDEVFSISPDFQHLVRLDRNTGARLETVDLEDRPEWNGARYLLTDGKRIYGVAAAISAFDPSQMTTPLWTSWPRARGEGQGMLLPGRVHLGGNRIYVPTGSGITEIATDTGEVTRRLEVPGSVSPLIVDGHLLVGGPEGLSLYSDEHLIRDQLQTRLQSTPNHLGTNLALVRIAARSGDRLKLIRQAARVIVLITSDPSRPDEERSLARQIVFDEVRSSLDPDEVVSSSDHEAIADLLGQLTQASPLAASAQLALGDWIVKTNTAQAVDHWRHIEDGPSLADLMHEEDTVLAPAGHWARIRLDDVARRHPDLVADVPWNAVNPAASWSRRLAAQAANLRSQRDHRRLGETTAALLADAIQQGRSEDGLALLDLWNSQRRSDWTLAGSRSEDQWRTELVESTYPTVAHSKLIGGESKLWGGRLLSRRSAHGLGRLPTDAFIRSHENRIWLHEAPTWAPRWMISLPHRSAAVVQQDSSGLVLIIEQLGQAPRLVSLNPEDGRVLWALDLVESLFSTAVEPGHDEDVALPATARIAVIPLESSIALLHPNGAAMTVQANGDGCPVWSTPPAVFMDQLHTRWQDGVAAIGYRDRSSTNKAWVRSVPEPGDMVLTWYDGANGNATTIELPTQMGGARWMEANALGDLVIGGTNGVALIRNPGEAPTWISRDWPLQAHRTREDARVTPQALVLTDLNNITHAFSLQTGRALPPDVPPGGFDNSSLPRVTVSGDRIWMKYDSQVMILDSLGRLIGSDATSRTQGDILEAVVPFADALVLVAHVRQQPTYQRTAALTASSHHHRIHLLSPEGRTNDLVDLFDLNSRIRTARALDGALLLATDDQVLTVTLPPALVH